MMHSFEGLADDISSLLKNRGDTGDRGDTAKNMSPINAVSVTPRGPGLSPLKIEGCQHMKSRGDSKNVVNQSFIGAVTPVTRVTPYSQQGLADDFGGKPSIASHAFSAKQSGGCHRGTADIPQAWMEGLSAIRSMHPLEDFSGERWQQLIADAHTFLDRWGRDAEKLGWSTIDLFGVHPAAPVARCDAKGLILTLSGNPVTALSENLATIRMPSGSMLRFDRSIRAAGVCIWEVR